MVIKMKDMKNMKNMKNQEIKKNKNGKLKKSTLFLIAMCSLLLLSLCFATQKMYAYYLDTEEKNNILQIGYNETEINEDFEKPAEIKSNTTFKKNPTVKNTGTVPCYVRMYVEVNDSRIAQYTFMNFNTEDWTERQSDGYYYYKKILNPNESTTPIFTTVNISDDNNVTKVIKEVDDFDIIVYEESVQSEGFTNYTDAWNKLNSSN